MCFLMYYPEFLKYYSGFVCTLVHVIACSLQAKLGEPCINLYSPLLLLTIAHFTRTVSNKTPLHIYRLSNSSQYHSYMYKGRSFV